MTALTRLLPCAAFAMLACAPQICAAKAEADKTDFDRELGECVAAMKRLPPSPADTPGRRKIFEALDALLQRDISGNAQAEREFSKAVDVRYSAAADEILSGLEKKPNGKLSVWKGYNMGFAVRGPQGASAGIDLSFEWGRGRDIDEARAERLAERLDILLVTHEHGDHFSRNLIRAMLKAGKPVISPSLEIIGNSCGKDGITVLHGADGEANFGGIKLRIFAGSQMTSKTTSIPCNVYLLDIGGAKILHNGDNTDQSVYKDAGNADIALANCWSGFSELIRHARPSLVIPGHESELNHRGSGRKRFLSSYEWFERNGHPAPIVMFMGESISR